MSILDPNYGLDPLQQSLQGFQRPPPQPMVPGPTGNGLMSALRGVDPTALMLLGSSLLQASGHQPTRMSLGQRLGGAVGQALPQILNQQSVQERTALAKQELAQTQAEHKMKLDQVNATHDYVIKSILAPIEKRIHEGTAQPEDFQRRDVAQLAIATNDYGSLSSMLGKSPEDANDLGKSMTGKVAQIFMDTGEPTKDNAPRLVAAAAVADSPIVYTNEQGTVVSKKTFDYSTIPGATERVAKARMLMGGAGPAPGLGSRLTVTPTPMGPTMASSMVNKEGVAANPMDTVPAAQAQGFVAKPGAPPQGYTSSDYTNPAAPVTAIAGGPATKLTTEEAGKQALFQEAQKGIPRIKELLFNPDGSVNRKNIITSSAVVGGLPFSEGSEAATLMETGLQAQTRVETGAAMPQEEITNTRIRLQPTYRDSDAVAKVKMQMYEDMVSGNLNLMKLGRGKPGENAVLDVPAFNKELKRRLDEPYDPLGLLK